MRIYSLSRIVALPFVVILAVLGYLEFILYWNIGWWMFAPLAVIVSLIILHGDLDYWWLKKHPIPLTKGEKDVIKKYVPYYSGLGSVDQQKFEDRLSLYIGAREWKNVGAQELKEIPDDIKALIASQVIMLTSHDEDYLLGDIDRIYTYKHPFPSPRFQFLHTYETNIEDGILIFSMEHALPGITKPDQFYNVVMHGYAEAFVHLHPRLSYPSIEGLAWEAIFSICGFTKEQILGTLGYDSVDLLPILITMFFTYPAQTRLILPEEYDVLKRIFS